VSESKSKLARALKLLEEIIVDCPHSVDEATVPKLGLGIEHLPAEQVVFNYSISYARMKEAKKLLQIRHTNSDFNNRDEREE